MERMMDEAMADGAYGLATGLIYAPGSYAATEEIIGIARRAAGGRGFYASHIRGEGATLLDAVAEAIRVGREGGLPTQVSHVKAAGRPNWGKVADALALIDAARAQGQDVMGDVYPYTASSTTLRTLLPDWVLEGGIDAMLKRLADPGTRDRIRAELTGGGETLLRGLDWSDIMVAYSPSRPDAQGRRIAEIAAARGEDPLDAAIELIVAEQGKGYMILFQLDEADLRRALVHPHVMIGSDGSSLAADGPARRRQAAPAQLRHLPARARPLRARRARALARDRGVEDDRPARAAARPDATAACWRSGAKADVVVFDAATVADRATYEDPHRYAAGIGHVLVNGRVVIAGGEHTGALPGRVLRPA